MYFSGQKFCLGMLLSCSCEQAIASYICTRIIFVVHVDLGMGMWGFIFLTTVLGMCSQFCMTIGMQHEKSARATLMRMSDVIGAFTWQILFTHDKVNRYSASGMSYHCCYLIVVSHSCNYMFVRRRVNFLRSACSGHI